MYDARIVDAMDSVFTVAYLYDPLTCCFFITLDDTFLSCNEFLPSAVTLADHEQRLVLLIAPDAT
jgi:hypothetical protein